MRFRGIWLMVVRIRMMISYIFWVGGRVMLTVPAL
jgi:hypothetical protein